MALTDLMSMAKPNAALLAQLLGKLDDITPYSCYQCMRCTSGCTSMKLLETKPHEIIDLIKLGFIEELLNSDSIWSCAVCLKCKERCPQRVAPSDIILALRNLAVEREAHVPEGYLKMFTQIMDTGLMQNEQKVPGSDHKTYDRTALGLPELVYPSEKFKTAFMNTLGL